MGWHRRNHRRPAPASSVPLERRSLTKLIFWLAGLLFAIITMNVTVYLGLTALYLGGRAVKRLVARRLGFGARDESSGNLPPRSD